MYNFSGRKSSINRSHSIRKPRLLTLVFVAAMIYSLLPAFGVMAALLPPTIVEAFDGITAPAIDTVHAGQTVIWSLTISNPNAAGNTLTGVNVTVGLPPSVKFLTPITITGNCGGGTIIDSNTGGANGSGQFTLNNGTIPGTGNCVISAPVTSLIPGTYDNTTGAVNAGNANPSNNTGEAILTVLAKLTAPAITKSFAPPVVPFPPGGSSALTITIPNTNVGVNANYTSVNLTDTLPAGLTITTPAATTNGNCIGTGSLTATTGTGAVTLLNGTIPSGLTCTITVNVTASAVGSYANTIKANDLTFNGGGNTAPASATLDYEAPLVETKAFAPSPFQAGTTTVLTLTITNPAGNPSPQTNINFTDNFPAGMVVDSPSGLAHSAGCINGGVAGAITAASGSATVAINSPKNVTINPGASCVITVNVTSSTVPGGGSYTNLPTTLQGTDNTVVINGTINGATVGVTGTSLNPPVTNKLFNGLPSTSIANGTSVPMTITIQNTNALPMRGVSFTDALPAGLIFTSPTGLGQVNCGVAPTTAGTTLTLANGTIPANTTCTITVNVTGVIVGGPYTNTTSVFTTTNAGTGATASAQLTVTTGGAGSNPLTITKAFLPTTIAPGGVSTITFTISNPDSFAQFGATFTDTLPSAPGRLVIATPPNVRLPGGNPAGCPAVGRVTAAADTQTITLSGNTAVIPANTTCAFEVDVTTPTSGTYNNTTGVISSANVPTGGTTSNTAVLTVSGPPSILPATINKAFGVLSVPLNGTTTLTFTINNPNDGTAGNGTVNLTTYTFVDGFPGGINLANTTITTNTCGGVFNPALAAGATSVTYIAASLAPGTCTITITVAGVTAGTSNNAIGTNKSVNGGDGPLPATVPLTIVAPPTVTKGFAPNPVSAGGNSTLTLTIKNPGPGVNTVPVTGVNVTDVLPVGPGQMTAVSVVAPSVANCGAGATWTIGTTVTANDTLTFAGGTIPVNGTCTLTATVLAPATGTYPNTTGTITSTNGGTGATSNTVTLITNASLASLTINKTFNPTTLPVNQISSMKIKLTNPAAATQNGVSFTDPFPAGLVFAATPNEVGNCNGGTVTVDTISNTLSLTGGQLTAGANCTLTVDVTSALPQTFTNSTAATSPLGGTGGTTSATITFVGPPVVAKSIAPSPILLGQTSTMTIQLTNPNSTTSLVGVTVNDTSMGGILVANPASATIDPVNCGAMTFSPALTAGATAVHTINGTIPVGQICTITVVVTAPAGTYTNTINPGDVTSTNGGSSTGIITAQLVVLAPTATNTSTVTNTSTSTNTPTDTATVTPSATDTPTDTVTVTPSATDTPTDTATVTPSATDTPTDTATVTPSATDTPTDTATVTPSATDTPTDTATVTPSATDTPTDTATVVPSATDTPTDTATVTPSATDTPTDTATVVPSATDTPTNTATSTLSPSNTPTSTATFTPTDTSTATSTLKGSTATSTATNTGTTTATVTPTTSGTVTSTGAASVTPTATATGTLNTTITATGSGTATPTATLCLTPTATATRIVGAPTPTSSPTLSIGCYRATPTATKVTTSVGSTGTPNVGVADPLIAKFSDPTLARPGDPVKFVITVSNDGTAPALNTTVTDPLPSLVVFVSATTTQGSFSVSGQTITFNLGTVNPGQVITIVIRAKVSANTKPPVEIVNTASLNGRKTSSSTTRITAGGLPATGELPTDDGGLPWTWLIPMAITGGLITWFIARRRYADKRS